MWASSHRRRSPAGGAVPAYAEAMSTFRTSVAAAVVATALLVPTTAQAAPASRAGNSGCVTAGEYSKVRNGTLLSTAHRVFGTSGKLLFQNGTTVGNGAREYPMCRAFARATGHRKAQLQYNNYATKGGPMRVVNVQHY